MSLLSIQMPSTTKTWCFVGTGGFALEENFVKINASATVSLQQVDITQAVQVFVDVRDFNNMIGLTKKNDNIGIEPNTSTEIFSSYNDAEDNFMVKPAVENISGSPGAYNWVTTEQLGDITITASDLHACLQSAMQIGETGAFTGIYSRFKSDVLQYFGWAGGFASLFTGSSDFAIASGVDVTGKLTPRGMYDLLTSTTAPGTDPAVHYINPITGGLVLKDVIKLLRYAVDSNAFNNRTSSAILDLDAHKMSANKVVKLIGGEFTNFGVGDGFLHGDLFYFPEGLSCTLKLELGNEGETEPLNNIGSALVARIETLGEHATVKLTAGETLIQHVVKAPLLIRLVDNLTTAPGSTNPDAKSFASWVV